MARVVLAMSGGVDSSVAAHLLRRIRPELDVERAETLRPGLAKRRTVQTLAQRHEAVFQGVRQAGTHLAELQRDLESRRGEVAALGRSSSAHTEQLDKG